MAFDIQAARKAGYTDDEIADFLGNQSKFDVAGARKAGYTAPEIVGFLSQAANDAKPAQGLTPLDTEQVTSARPWQGAGAGRGSPNDPRRVDVERKPETFERPGFSQGFEKALGESERPLTPGGLLLRAADAFTGGFAQERYNKAQASVLDDKTSPTLATDFAKDQQAPKQPPKLEPRTDTISPTGGVVDALKDVPVNVARSTGSTLMNFGALAAEFGLTIQSAEQFRKAGADLDKAKARTGLGVSDEPLLKTGTAADALIPSAKTIADYAPEGIKQLGMIAAMGSAAIVADAGARGVSKAREDGLGLIPSLLYGAGQAATEGVPEAVSAKFAIEAARRIPLGAALRGDAKAVTTAFQQTAQTMGVEFGSEQASALGNWVVDKIAADPTATPDRLVADMQEAVKATMVQGPTMLAGAKALQTAATGMAQRPEQAAARALAADLESGQLPAAQVETLNPNLAIQRKTQEGLINIGAAQTVDDAIAAATQATAPQTQAVDNIARLLGETPDVSQPGNIPAVDSGSSGLGAPEPAIGVDTGVGVSGAAERALDAGSAGNQPDGGTVPLGDGGATPALSPDIADTASRIRELEGAPTTEPGLPQSKPNQETRDEPASMWFGRRGDGYQTPEDASAALPSRQRVSPDLDWKVEQMPSGRYRLAGYDTQTQQPASFKVTLNPTGTATIIGNPDAIKAKLAEAGIDKVMSGADRVIVGTSQAQAAVQVLQTNQPPALANTAQPAINSVANDQNQPTRENGQAQAPAVEAPKGGVYTLTDAISADGPVSETVRLIVRPDGSSAIQRENGDVIDVTNMIRAGFSAERAIAQSLGDDTSGKNVSRNEQNPPKKPEPKAKAPAVEAPAPAGGDATGTAGLPAAGTSGGVEAAGVGETIVSANSTENIDGVRAAKQSGKKLSYGQYGDGTVTVGPSLDAKTHITLRLAPAERKALNKANALDKLAESQDERQEANKAFEDALAPAIDRAISKAATDPGTTQVEGGGVAAAQAAYAAAASKFNALVPQLKAAREAGDQAEIERLSDEMRPLDIAMRKAHAFVSSAGLKAAADAASIEQTKRFAGHQISQRVRPSEFPDGNIYWQKEADNSWSGHGAMLEGKTATNAQLADRGGLVDMAPVEGRGLNHKETPPEPGIYKLANGAFAKFDDGMWTRGESDPKAAMRSQMFIPGNMKPADREVDQAWQFHSGFTRDAMGEPARLKPAKTPNPPTQAQAGTLAEGAGESRPAPVAATVKDSLTPDPRLIPVSQRKQANGFENLLSLKSTKLILDDGRGRKLYDVQVTPAFRNKHFVNGRMPVVDGLELKHKADVTGVPQDNGWVLIDSREQQAQRDQPAINLPKKQAKQNTSAEPAQKTPESEQVAAAQIGNAKDLPDNSGVVPGNSGPYGRDLTPIAQGGKPFKSLEEAKAYRKKNTNNMVVKKVGKNQYVLQEASAKQIAAWDKAGKRLGIPQAGGEGPQHVHGFLIGKGGLNKKLMADAGFDRNHRIGNRTLFAGTGGMTAERATELLTEAGYLKAGASHSDMFALVRKSVQTPQYTSDGWEQLAQAEQSTRFEDHLAVEQEATPEADDFDALFPRGDDAYTPEEIALVPKSVREEYAALIEAAEAAGVDVDAILEDGARISENQTQEQFNEYVRQALTDAIADSRREADRRESAVQGRQDAERGGTEGSRQDAGGSGAQEGVGRAAAESAATRTRPRGTINFANPITGPSGTKLTAYTWQWKPMEFVDARGEDRVARISDWDNSETNAETGREVVHQFVVEQNGESKTVSAESAIRALGYGTAAEAGTAKSAISAAKTLARLQMQLSEVAQAVEAYEADKAEVVLLTPPEISGPDEKGWYSMGDTRIRQLEKGPLRAERRRTLLDHWRDDRLSDRGWKGGSIEGGSLQRTQTELQDRIKRVAKKLDAINSAALTAPTPAQVLEQQDRADRAEELDQREQIQREAEGFQLQAQAPEQRQDNTGDMFGGPSAEDVMRARKPGKRKEDDGTEPMFRRGGIDDETRAQNLKKWSNNAPYVSSAQADAYDFKTGQKVMVEAYHGTARPDRVGTVFQRKRATSGPMAFFTSAPELASSYAKGKADTSITDEERNYPQWFKYTPAGQRSAVDIVRAWNFLPNETKDRIAALAPRIKTDDATGEQIEIGPEGTTNGVGNYEWEVQQTQRPYDRRGNPLKALVEGWLNGGMLFNEEERFLRVLELAGVPVKDVNYDAPNAAYPFVYKTYIAMQKPLVTGDVPQPVIDALQEAAKRDRSRAQAGGADMWDKNTRTLREWVANFTDPDNTSASYVWTSIPDKVTDVLKSMGYDGIIDWSGKGGGDRHPVYIPFEETQVKSALGNKGTFDPLKKNILLSRGTPAWRSELRDQIAAIKMESSKPEGWRAYISGLATKGVKPDEIEWSGVTDWLKLQTGKVTKQQILDYLDGNGVQVQEVVKGEMPEDGWRDEAGDLIRDGSLGTKYSQYTLPGGENYREVLLTLPEKTSADPARAEYEAWAQRNGLTPNATMAEQRYERETGKVAPAPRTMSAMQADAAKNYKSSHWDTPNVLAHIRLNDRTDADGKRVLFVEEVQSDWGQDGKKKGFAPKPGELPVGWKRVETAAGPRLEDPEGNWHGVDESVTFGVTASGRVPLAPFVTSTDKWLSLALKRIITMAAQEGYDRVAFVNGEQSAERYDLSKQISKISYEKADNGNYEIYAYDMNGTQVLHEGEDVEIPLSRIEDLVGKEIAKKIANGEGAKWDGSPARDWRDLTGLDLKVGGEGMRAFYDKILPNTLKYVLKKVGGGSLETVSLGGKDMTPGFFPTEAAARAWLEANKPAEVAAVKYEPRYKQWSIRGENGSTLTLTPKQTGFTVTPEMRNKASNGLPMFRPGAESAGMPTSEAQAHVTSLTKKWKNGPPITVVATPADLPMDAPGDARGVYWKGQVWVVAGPHKDRADLSKTLAHEAIAHFGLKNILTDAEWRRYMANIQVAIKAGNKSLTAIRDNIRERYVDGDGELYLTEQQEADEIAAKVAELAVGPDGEFRPGFGFVKAVYAKIMQFLRELGLDVNLTLAEVQGMLVLAQKNLEAGKRTVGQGDVVVAAGRGDQRPMDMRAYHGTPHKVDKFSTDKIGTGEGAQAYGWGLYFTDTKEIAAHYRHLLVQRDPQRLTLDGKRVDPNSMLGRAIEDMTKIGKAAVLQKLDDNIAFNEKYAPAMAESYRQARATVESLSEDRIAVKNGNLYEVEIPEASEMLLWDKPLSEQPDGVNKAVQKVERDRLVSIMKQRINARAERVKNSENTDAVDRQIEVLKEEINAFNLPLGGTGERYYKSLSQKLGGDKAASEYLASLGIKGIKYLDGTSRDKGEGSFNYVVFSGDDVAIQNAMFSRSKDQTNTPEFAAWFGDSVVTDTGKAGGRPLRVYHGTHRDFSAFDEQAPSSHIPLPGFYFTPDPDIASVFAESGAKMAENKAGRPYEPIGATVMPVYLSLQNPLDFDASEGVMKGFVSEKIIKEIILEAKRKGHDGVVIRGWRDGSGPVQYVVFNPEQIKSVFNRGSFDPADPNIMFSRGTTAAQEQEEPRRPNIALRAIGYQGMDDAGSPEFSPGRLLYNMIGAGASPLLTKMNLKAASPELRQIMRKMKIDVAKAQETAAAVAKESMALTEDERQMVSDLIEKELQAGTIPPEHAIRLAATINTVMGKQTDELLRLGMLSPESAERWRGEYLPRFYESKLTATATASDLWADAVRKAAGGGKPLKGIRGKHLRGRGMYETIPVTQLADYETMGWEVRDPDYQPGLTDDGMVQVWRDFTRQERDKMGEIRDAGFRFVMGYMQTQKDIALGRMFEALATNPEMSSKTATEELSVHVPTGTAPGTEVKTYGKLAGRYVSPETLSQLSMIEEAQSEALMMYRKAMGLWKESKTVLNPVAHANNVISNITMAHFAGVSYGRVDKYLAAVRDFATKSDDVLEAKDAGLFLGTMNEAELFNTLPEELKALAQTQEGTATKIGRSAFNLLSFYLRKPMGWAYQAEDTFFRYLIYKEARGRGLSPDDAVDYAQKFIFTYDDLPKGARLIRDFGIPFFAYTYKAIPALLETALTHPERFAAPMAVIMAANAVAYAIAAGDDDDSWELKLKKYLNDPEYRKEAKAKEQLERELLPEWLKGKTALGTDKTVRLGTDELTKLPMFLDMSRMIPGGDLLDVRPNSGGIPWPQPLTPNHPLLAMTTAIFANKDTFYGKDIVNERTDTAEEAARKRMDWMWKQMTPAIAYGNYHWERWMNALAQATGKEVQWAPEWATDKAIATGIGRDGLPVQPKLAAMQTFGIKARPYDLDKAEEIQRSMTNKDVREIEAEMRSLRRLMDLGAVSDRTYDRKREAADEKKERLRDGQTVDGKPR